MIERLLCPDCGWTGVGVEGAACGACGSADTTGCGPTWGRREGCDCGQGFEPSDEPYHRNPSTGIEERCYCGCHEGPVTPMDPNDSLRNR